MKKSAKGVRKGGCPHPPCRTKSGAPSPRTRAFGATWSIAALGMLLVFFLGCSKEPAEKEPVVPVQVAAVEKTTIEHTVIAEAVLFPLAQSAIVPKISAPVKTFLVTRG